jgi:hypothetical protein
LVGRLQCFVHFVNEAVARLKIIILENGAEACFMQSVGHPPGRLRILRRAK